MQDSQASAAFSAASAAASPGAPSVRISRLEKSYRNAHLEQIPVLSGFDLVLRPGDSLAVTGPSGSGKSTLLHILGTLDRPDSGEVEIAGGRPFELDDDALAAFRHRHIGFVFQEHFLLPQYSVLENVLLPTLIGGRGEGAGERARGLLDRVGLGKRLEHRPAELSGGERQRVAVARALINDPELLLCDEPTGSLDPKTARQIAELLFEIHQAERKTLVVVTHSQELASRFPRRIEIQDGRCSTI
jgi:lipoprotein-releasing system ATP-binding protein